MAASLSGNLEDATFDAGFEALLTSGLDVDVNLGDVEIEYCYYYDMVTSQEAHVQALNRLNNAVKASNKGQLPGRRTITAALRVRNAKITVKRTAEREMNLAAAVSGLLSKLGLGWNRDTKEFAELVVGDNWKYIAYQSIVSNEERLVTSGAQPDLPGGEPDFALPLENRPWLQ